MRIIDIKKYKQELMDKFAFEFKDWMSPAMRDYWTLFKSKADENRSQLLLWVKEYSILENGRKVDVAQKPVQLSPEANILFNQLKDQLGEVVHIGDWFQVTQDLIDDFADITDDHQWIHNDVEKAKEESPFKTTIAHGFLTLSLLPKLTDSVDPKNALYPTAKMTVNYGLNQVRFPYPVKSESIIRSHSRLIKVTPIKRGLEIEKEITIEIKDCRRPACVAVSVVRVYF